MIVQVRLTSGGYALIDEDDAERVRAFRWGESREGRSVYARMTNTTYIPARNKSLHRFVMRATPDVVVDHINGNGLDNRRCNLRLCSSRENSLNRRMYETDEKSSRFKGVRLSGRRWVATIGVDGEQITIGAFDDEAEAAKAYDAAALEKFGEFARTNESLGLFRSVPGLSPSRMWRGPSADASDAFEAGGHFMNTGRGVWVQKDDGQSFRRRRKRHGRSKFAAVAQPT